jgi:8-oxo-dGTP diphosphatase
MELTQIDRGIFLVNLLGVIFDPVKRKLLIGRRVNDPYLTKLSWAFPGGRPEYNNELEFYLKKNIKSKTGLDIEIDKIIFAKTYPERRDFLSVYYLCHIVGGEEKAGDNITELKWIKPSEIKENFTTSVHPVLLDYLMTLE